MAMLLEPGCVVDELLGGFDLGCHVGEGEVDALEARDRPAELLARGGIRQALLQRALSESERQGGDADPAAVERMKELAEPVVYRSENIFLGTIASWKISSRVSDALQPSLSSFFPERTPRFFGSSAE